MMQADVEEMANQIAKELIAQQTKFFQDEMKNMLDEMSKMKEELSKKVENAISGKNEATKDNASDVGAGEHAHGKKCIQTWDSIMDNSSKVQLYILLSSTLASHLTLMEQDTPIGLTR